MKKTGICEVLRLGEEFGLNSDALIDTKPELQEEAQRIRSEAFEAEGQNKMNELEPILKNMPKSLSKEEGDAWAQNNEDYQRIAVEILDIFAKTTSQLLSAEEIDACLPTNLKGNAEAAQLLRDRGGNHMAALCMNGPV